MKRFITYFFTYDNGKRGRNIGFVRVDQRADTYHMEVHLQGLGQFRGIGTVFLLHGENRLSGEKVGNIDISQGRGVWVLDGTEEYLCENAPLAKRPAGVAIRFGERLYAASSWRERVSKELIWGTYAVEEDIPQADGGQEGIQKQAQERPRESAEKRAQGRPQENAEKRAQERPRESAEKRAQERPQENAEEQAQERAPKGAEEQAQGRPQESAEEQAQGRPQESAEKRAQERPRESTEEQAQERTPKSAAVYAQERTAKSTQECRQERTAESGSPASQTGEGAPTRVERENVQPSSSEDLPHIPSGARIRRIDLSDIKKLPKRNWYLCNNSFLIHGFFNYHYLILEEVEEEGRTKCYLGVPGIYEKPERMMAMMFGFSGFELERESEQTPENFGYWLCLLDM